MKKTIASMFETGVLHLVVLCLVFALALCFAGCSVTKINYEKDEKGVVSYRLYRNDHWLKTSGTGISGGMTKDGKFEFAAEGLERSPSEEFNRTMQTYTSALVQFMQIAAAAYNPSSSAAAANVSRGDAETRSVASQSSTGNNAASDPHAAECTDGSCTPEVK
ncbi:MAG: hypothetical protein II840_02580 [Kiritimatiellae bacterium]|nr:hypothetical protein [Kiritimatiellia bacterium]